MNEQVMLTKRLAMIRSDHDQRVIEEPPLLQFRNELAHLIVDIGDGPIVSIDLALQFFGRGRQTVGGQRLVDDAAGIPESRKARAAHGDGGLR
ncbi:MAG TPA: hypothetical protein VNW97_21290 [Candidatus Saccharimonadales bacterium]|jgi:hypothetical protein|nr:hypothetical protein [Candidatus Saccharimonadales bacterium]